MKYASVENLYKTIVLLPDVERDMLKNLEELSK